MTVSYATTLKLIFYESNQRLYNTHQLFRNFKVSFTMEQYLYMCIFKEIKINKDGQSSAHHLTHSFSLTNFQSFFLQLFTSFFLIFLFYTYIVHSNAFNTYVFLGCCFVIYSGAFRQRNHTEYWNDITLRRHSHVTPYHLCTSILNNCRLRHSTVL